MVNALHLLQLVQLPHVQQHLLFDVQMEDVLINHPAVLHQTVVQYQRLIDVLMVVVLVIQQQQQMLIHQMHVRLLLHVIVQLMFDVTLEHVLQIKINAHL